jgi:hypothetical protein
LHDALEAERLGIPAVAVITENFVKSAQVVAKINGLPDYKFVVIGHPIANDSDEVLHAKAQGAIEEIVALLTKRDA